MPTLDREPCDIDVPMVASLCYYGEGRYMIARNFGAWLHPLDLCITAGRDLQSDDEFVERIASEWLNQ